jgi:hypothetical protein
MTEKNKDHWPPPARRVRHPRPYFEAGQRVVCVDASPNRHALKTALRQPKQRMLRNLLPCNRELCIVFRASEEPLKRAKPKHL